MEHSIIENVGLYLQSKVVETLNKSSLIGYGVNKTIYPNRIVISAGTPLRFILFGRGAGKFPPPNIIKSWIDRNSISQDKSATYLISRKISSHGTKGKPNVVDEIRKIDIKPEVLKQINRVWIER